MVAFRKKLQTTAYKIMLWFMLLGFAGVFSLVEIIRFTGRAEDWVVQVNKRVIRYQALLRSISGQQSHIDMFKAYYGPQADFLAQLMGMQLNPVTLALDKSIRDALLEQTDLVRRIPLDEEYIMRKSADVDFIYQVLPEMISPDVIDKNGIVLERLRQHLRSMGLQVADFERALKQAIHAEFIMRFIGTFGYATGDQIRNEIINEHAAKKFFITTVPIEPFIKELKQASISDAELNAYFMQPSVDQKYWVPEKRSGQTWTFSYKNYGISIDDSAVSTYYVMNREKEFLVTPPQIQVRKLTFDTYEEADAARTQYMNDVVSFESAAELVPFFARNTHESDFDRAAFSLQKEGSFSSVFKVSKGFEFVQLVAKKVAVYQTRKEAETSIVDTLTREQFIQRFTIEAQAICARMKQTGSDEEWLEFVKNKKAQKTAFTLVPQNQTPQLKTLFEVKNSADYLAQTYADAGVVARLDAIEKRFLPALETIKGQVRSDYIAQKAVEKVEQALATLEKNGNQENETAQFHTQSHMTSFIKKTDKESMKQLESLKANGLQALSLDRVGSTFTTMGKTAGYLIKLEEVEAVSNEVVEQAWQAAEQSQDSERIMLSQRAFLASLYRNATIEINESLLNELEQRISI